MEEVQKKKETERATDLGQRLSQIPEPGVGILPVNNTPLPVPPPGKSLQSLLRFLLSMTSKISLPHTT